MVKCTLDWKTWLLNHLQHWDIQQSYQRYVLVLIKSVHTCISPVCIHVCIWLFKYSHSLSHAHTHTRAQVHTHSLRWSWQTTAMISPSFACPDHNTFLATKLAFVSWQGSRYANCCPNTSIPLMEKPSWASNIYCEYNITRNQPYSGALTTGTTHTRAIIGGHGQCHRLRRPLT